MHSIKCFPDASLARRSYVNAQKQKYIGYSKEKFMIVRHIFYDKINVYTSLKGKFSC